MIGAVCAYAGFVKADRLKRRRDFLVSFTASLTALETEIVFGMAELKSIFRRMAQRADSRAMCGIYSECAERMDDAGIRSAWETAAREAGERAALLPEEISALMLPGGELGMSDAEGQKNALRCAGKTLQLCRDNAVEEYDRLARVYRYCGVLAGAFVVIVIGI